MPSKTLPTWLGHMMRDKPRRRTRHFRNSSAVALKKPLTLQVAAAASLQRDRERRAAKRPAPRRVRVEVVLTDGMSCISTAYSSHEEPQDSLSSIWRGSAAAATERYLHGIQLPRGAAGFAVINPARLSGRCN